MNRKHNGWHVFTVDFRKNTGSNIDKMEDWLNDLTGRDAVWEIQYGIIETNFLIRDSETALMFNLQFGEYADYNGKAYA